MTGKILSAGLVGALILPFIHPFGSVRRQHSDAGLPDIPAIESSCQSCHSERTEWPLYSYLPGVNWLLEKDVADARMHMNLSRWAEYSNEHKQDLLARIAAEVRNREMPPARYTIFHPKARLSDGQIQQICQWTKIQRHKLRSEGINQPSRESVSIE